MASASASENVTALTRAAIKHARGRSAGVVDGHRGTGEAGGLRAAVAPPFGAHPKVKQSTVDIG